MKRVVQVALGTVLVGAGLVGAALSASAAEPGGTRVTDPDGGPALVVHPGGSGGGTRVTTPGTESYLSFGGGTRVTDPGPESYLS
ncbi:hypothetical protein [Pseudonocardia sp. GCM10023141]|uniref:hypothetical protein n=1 Tax=Pseudonocardia sp. GCM10023141 TaxID=3252653 RepID=UPI00360794A0